MTVDIYYVWKSFLFHKYAVLLNSLFIKKSWKETVHNSFQHC